MKVAVFQVVSNGEDGRAPTKIHFSSTSEIERDHFYNDLGKNKPYYSTIDTVLDLSMLGKTMVNKLDGNDKMILKMCLCFDHTLDSLTTSYFDTNVICYEPKK